MDDVRASASRTIPQPHSYPSHISFTPGSSRQRDGSDVHDTHYRAAFIASPHNAHQSYGDSLTFAPQRSASSNYAAATPNSSPERHSNGNYLDYSTDNVDPSFLGIGSQFDHTVYVHGELCTRFAGEGPICLCMACVQPRQNTQPNGLPRYSGRRHASYITYPESLHPDQVVVQDHLSDSCIHLTRYQLEQQQDARGQSDSAREHRRCRRH